MIVYVTSDQHGQIRSFLDVDIKEIAKAREGYYAPNCKWRVSIDADGELACQDVVIFESDDEGIMQTGIEVEENSQYFKWVDRAEYDPEAELKAITQSIPNGTTCIFDLRGQAFEFGEHQTALYKSKLEIHDRTRCIVESLETYTELGDQDYEYYNIKVKSGFEMTGVSGYHLTVIKQ